VSGSIARAVLDEGTTPGDAELEMKSTGNGAAMTKAKQPGKLKDGAQCEVVGGTHAGKRGTVRDINTSKTGHVTITVVQASGERFKTLAKNVAVQK
jgi:KOW motif